MTNIPVILIKELYKKYQIGKFDLSSLFFKKNKEILALENVNFNINRLDRIGIIGLNGSGKSTLLKIISRVTYPTSGEVMIQGKVSSVLEAGSGFHPELTGLENIYLSGAILGMSRKLVKQKVEEIITFSKIQDYINTPVKRYSTGMLIKLAFSVSAFLDGDILIFDEIMAVADDAFKKEATSHILKQVDKTIIFVSHDEKNIKDICNRAVLLDKGRLLLDGEVSKVLSEYNLLNNKN
jgi:lipopolysaccharide transport system ATP-binding protein